MNVSSSRSTPAPDIVPLRDDVPHVLAVAGRRRKLDQNVPRETERHEPQLPVHDAVCEPLAVIHAEVAPLVVDIVVAQIAEIALCEQRSGTGAPDPEILRCRW